MGSGKTSVGRLLADRTGYYFKDTDELIVDKEGRRLKRFSIHMVRTIFVIWRQNY